MWLWRVVCLAKLSCNKEVTCPGCNSDFSPTQLTNKVEEEKKTDKVCLHFLCCVQLLDSLINWFNYVDGRLLDVLWKEVLNSCLLVVTHASWCSFWSYSFSSELSVNTVSVNSIFIGNVSDWGFFKKRGNVSHLKDICHVVLLCWLQGFKTTTALSIPGR